MIPLMLPEQVAADLQVSVKTLANWRALNQGPAFVKVGSRVRYEPAAVEAYVASLTPVTNVTPIRQKQPA